MYGLLTNDSATCASDTSAKIVDRYNHSCAIVGVTI